MTKLKLSDNSPSRCSSWCSLSCCCCISCSYTGYVSACVCESSLVQLGALVALKITNFSDSFVWPQCKQCTALKQLSDDVWSDLGPIDHLPPRLHRSCMLWIHETHHLDGGRSPCMVVVAAIRCHWWVIPFLMFQRLLLFVKWDLLITRCQLCSGSCCCGGGGSWIHDGS